MRSRKVALHRSLLALTAALVLMLPSGSGDAAVTPAQSAGDPPRVGSCWMLNRSQLDALSWTYSTPVPCNSSHTLEVTGAYWVPETLRTRGRTSTATYAFMEKKCLESVNQYQGTSRYNLGFHYMLFTAPQSLWNAGGTWVVCGGTPQLWIGNDIVYGKTVGAFRRSFFAPQCDTVSSRGVVREVRCGARGARPYSRVPLNFRYLELMRYPGRKAVEARCSRMAKGNDFYCWGALRKQWNGGVRSLENIRDRSWRGPVPRLNITPI